MKKTTCKQPQIKRKYIRSTKIVKGGSPERGRETQSTTLRKKPIPREWALGETYDVKTEDLQRRIERALMAHNYGEARMYQDMIDARMGVGPDPEYRDFCLGIKNG
jgi:hypothetical protein